MPVDTTNMVGRVVLGYIQGEDSNEHLDYSRPLAEGFDISQGQVDIVVPQVDPRNDYIIVLFGDSGNRSSRFTIGGS
ncbi:hypothetical protein AX17_003714 [Amanita inopinata Kibby_2008]|nr:hypothetical protein AX17_003714 [Amanita inopinata Kibby_2008]